MHESLTPQERLRRIAEIVNKGIYLLALKEGWFVNSNQTDKKIQNQSQRLSVEEQEIIELCENKGRITNKDVQDLFGVHRNTATRKLKEMVFKGLLIQKGNSKGSIYISNVHNAKMCIKLVLKSQDKTAKIPCPNVHK